MDHAKLHAPHAFAGARPARRAVLYRMRSPEHICPFGLKSLDLLRRHGFEVEDHLLRSREATEAFKQRFEVDTTPQTFVDGRRIGGYVDLRRAFGLQPAAERGTRYDPVIAVFACTSLAALALQWAVHGTVWPAQALGWFVALSMVVLAVLKLRDLEAFSNSFLGYDLLAQRLVRYAYVYPFAELVAGLGMLSGLWPAAFGAIAVVIGGIGAVSVFKAVYIDHRALHCACVGGHSRVPLGAVSLTENLMMLGMGLWSLARAFGA
jgi:glutaredoxin